MQSTSERPSPRTREALGLFAGLPDRYDLMAELLSLGQNRRWQRFLVEQIDTPPGARILDVATGTAAVAIMLTDRGQGSVIGLDQSAPMIQAGARAVERAALRPRVALLLGKGERLPFADCAFDAVTFTYLLRYTDDPGATLVELNRVLRPGGMLGGMEFHVPRGALPRRLWWLYTRIGLPTAGRLVSRSWYEVGRFLSPSIEDFYRRYPLERQLALWRAAGVPQPQVRVMSLGGAVVIWGRKGHESSAFA